MNSPGLIDSLIRKGIGTPDRCSFRDYCLIWENFDPGADVQTRNEFKESHQHLDEGTINEIYTRYFIEVTKDRKASRGKSFKWFCKRCARLENKIPDRWMWACREIAADNELPSTRHFETIMDYLCKNDAVPSMIDATEQLWIIFCNETRRYST